MTLATKDRIQKICELLKNGDVTTVILDGKRGVGKTWMAREISKNTDLIHDTQWLYLNNNYVSDSLDEDIARQLSLLSFYEESEDGDDVEEEQSLKDLRHRICMKLLELRSAARKENKLFVLILDGAPHDQDVEEIMSEYKLLDGNEQNFFKVLITRGESDSRDNAKEINEGIELGHTRVYELDPLSVEESLILLGAEIKKEFSDSPSFGILSSVIVKISKCMPIVILTIAKELNYIGHSEFGVLSLESVLQEAADDGEAAISMLVHSLYDKLLSGVQTDCFWHSMQYFCTHAAVHYNVLITHWIMEGYVGCIDHIEKAYEQGHHVLMQLINRGMLRKEEDDMIMMGGILSSLTDHRRSGFNGTASLGLANVFEDYKWEGLGRLTHTDGMIKSSCSPKTWERVTTLIMDARCLGREVSERYFQHLQRLQVFTIFHPMFTSLPLPFTSIKSLSTLVLRCCHLLENIDHIQELENLSVLEISGATRLEVIPDDLFENMSNLRSLNLSKAKFRSLPSSLFEKTELRWLILRGCSELEYLPTLKSFTNLQVLDLSGAISFKKLEDRSFAPLQKLQTIDLSNSQINRLPFLHNLVELTRLLLSGCASLTRLPSLNTLSKLQILDLSGATGVKEMQDEPLDGLKVLDLSVTQISKLPSSISHLSDLYLRDCGTLLKLSLTEAFKDLEILDLSGSRNLSEIEDKSLQHMRFLRVLNFSNAKVKELPSLSTLPNLRQLLLVDCLLLEKLTGIEGLEKLQVFNLSGCVALVHLTNLNFLHKLEILNLSGCQSLESIPYNSFENMSNIRTINLSDTKIEVLPSLSKTNNLCHLILRNCKSLKEPPRVEHLTYLEELNLCGVISLVDAKAEFLEHMDYLRILDLAGTPLTKLPSMSRLTNLKQLSLKGCSSFETVPNLEALTLLEVLDLSETAIGSLRPLNTFGNLCKLLLKDCSRIEELQLLESLSHLEVLDLSGTTMKKFPYEISELTHLKYIGLPDLRSMDNLDLGKIKRIPQEVNWDQCGIFERANIFVDSEKPSILVSGSEIFHFLDKNPNLWETKFKKFHFSVIKKQGEDGDINCKDKLFCRDVYFHTRHFEFPKEHDRCLEIHGSYSGPNGFESVLQRADCISLVDNDLIRNLCEFGADALKVMKGCWIERCNKMEGIIFGEMEGVSLERSLEILWVSNLPSLRSLYLSNVEPEGFSNLKHLYIDSCPRIVNVFPSSQLPENLEILHVQFCDRLQTLFEGETQSRVTLKKLKTLYMLELPELMTIGVKLPAHFTFEAIECPKLLKLHSDVINQALVLETIPMAQEVEHYLMDKFRNGLDGSDKSISKIPRYNQFQEIKTLLEEIFQSPSPVNSSIKGKLYHLNDVLIECQLLSRKLGFNSPEELLTINRIRRELNKIKKELKVITDNNGAPNANTTPQPDNVQANSHETDLLRWTTRLVDSSKVHGFDDDVVSMKKLLFQQGRDDMFKAVGVVGRDGIGKTTLCQLLFHDKEVKDYFLPRIWVCMARHLDDDDDPKIAIVKKMLMYLGVEKEMVKFVFEQHGLAGLLYALQLQLVGKRYLIVLDDAKETDSWYGQLDSCLTSDKKWDDALAFGLPKGHGGRVIVTSRNQELAKTMVREENLHHLLPLSDPETCWEIFKDAVESDGIPYNPSNLEDRKLEIKQKCGGLPLAAKMIGEAMQEQQWNPSRQQES